MDRPLKGNSIIALPSDYTVIDVETTGLSFEWDSIIEIGALKVRGNKITDQFSTLIKPNSFSENEEFLDSFITELTGITDEMLKAAPLFSEKIQEIKDFISDDLIVGYNVNFDVNFLYDHFQIEGESFSNDFIDVMRIARKQLSDLPHHRLKDIAQFLNVPDAPNHRSLQDVICTHQCYTSLKENILSQKTEKEFADSFKRSHKSIDISSIVCQSESIDKTNPVYNKTVVFTGALSRMTRKDAMQIVVNLGGNIANSITKKTNFLVIGSEEFASTVKDGKTNKMKKAEEYILKGADISIVSENTFFDLIE